MLVIFYLISAAVILFFRLMIVIMVTLLMLSLIHILDSSRYWVQIGDTYMRQGRRNLDGYRMYYDLPESGVGGDHLSDLFDVSEVFDRRRPTPVPKMTE